MDRSLAARTGHVRDPRVRMRRNGCKRIGHCAELGVGHRDEVVSIALTCLAGAARLVRAEAAEPTDVAIVDDGFTLSTFCARVTAGSEPSTLRTRPEGTLPPRRRRSSNSKDRRRASLQTTSNTSDDMPDPHVNDSGEPTERDVDIAPVMLACAADVEDAQAQSWSDGKATVYVGGATPAAVMNCRICEACSVVWPTMLVMIQACGCSGWCDTDVKAFSSVMSASVLRTASRQ